MRWRAAWVWSRHGDRGAGARWLRPRSPSTIPALLIAGWWYWRNHTLYGDWTGVSHLTAINGLREKPLDLDDFWLEFRGLRYSFWGLFGWFNILLPSWFYAAMDLLSVVAIIGAVLAGLIAMRNAGRAVFGRSTAQVKLLLLAWIGLSIALILYWMMRATGSQGRLIFPALSAIAVWFVIGLDFWVRSLPQPWRNLAWAITPALLLGMSVYGVAVAIPAAYAAPDAVDGVPPDALSTQITYGDDEAITLLAVDAPAQRYRPGDAVPVTLYLTAPHAVDQDYELFIQLLDERGEVLGNVTSHPGWGRNPTSLWEAGAVYADEYAVPVTGDVDAARLCWRGSTPVSSIRPRSPTRTTPSRRGTPVATRLRRCSRTFPSHHIPRRSWQSTSWPPRHSGSVTPSRSAGCASPRPCGPVRR